MEPSTQIRTTIRHIATALGLSRAAISLGLRNSPQIAAATCRKIQATAAEMGYHPNLSATNLAHFRHSASEKTVHSAMAWINCWKNPADLRGFHQFDLYWRSAKTTAESAGYRLEEFVVDATSNVARLQNILLTRNIHGIIIPPQHRTSSWSKFCDGSFDWSRFSAVRIGHSIRNPAVSVVAPDQVGNCILAVEEISARGYERIGYVTLRAIRKSTQNWFLGGFHLAQIALPSSRHVPVLYLEERDEVDRERLAQWINRHKPDVILTEWNEIGKLLDSLGIKVPQQVGLVALNTLDCEIKAGIYQNPELIGEASAEVLIALMNRNERGVSMYYRTTTVMGKWQDGPTLPPKKVPRVKNSRTPKVKAISRP